MSSDLTRIDPATMSALRQVGLAFEAMVVEYGRRCQTFVDAVTLAAQRNGALILRGGVPVDDKDQQQGEADA